MEPMTPARLDELHKEAVYAWQQAINFMIPNQARAPGVLAYLPPDAQQAKILLMFATHAQANYTLALGQIYQQGEHDGGV